MRNPSELQAAATAAHDAGDYDVVRLPSGPLQGGAISTRDYITLVARGKVDCVFGMPPTYIKFHDTDLGAGIRKMFLKTVR